MTDIAAADGFEGWLKRADRRIRTIESAVGRARVPRNCTSTTRPDPKKLQPGVPVFETDTGYLLLVNAAQTGFLVFHPA